MENSRLENLKIAFFNDGYNIAAEQLLNGVNEASIVKMTSEIFKYVDSFIEAFLNHCKTEKSNVDCKKGCAFCCHQSVFTLPHEAYYLYLYLIKDADNPIHQQIKKKISEKDDITSLKKVDEIIRYNKACPFLIDDACAAYEARPVACRIFLSMNVRSCITERENPEDFSKYAKLYELPLLAGRMLNEGVCAFLKEKGMKPTEWFLESSVNLLYQNKSAIPQWILGEDLFPPREITTEEWEYLKKFDLNE